MDIKYLTKAKFLAGESIEGLHLYSFDHSTEGESMIELPAPRLTRMRQGKNIDFTPPAESLYIPPAIEEAQPDIYPEPQAPTTGPSESDETNRRIGMLEKLTKWQKKTIKALKNTVNEMKGQIKELQHIVNCSSAKPEAQGPVMMERSRSSSAAHMRKPPTEAPRVSATLHYQRKKRAARPPAGATSPLDQDVAWEHPAEQEPSRATSPLDQDVAWEHPADQETSRATYPLDQDVAWAPPLDPQPISYLPPSEDSAKAEYTKESMDETTSSFFSKP